MSLRSSQTHQPDTLPLAGRAGEGSAKSSRPATLAQKLRRQSTAPERRLWRLLFPFRTHFRKQVQVGTYIVDFACLHAGLIIEVDGDTHSGDVARSNDATRDDYLRGRGFEVLRFTNDDVLTNAEGVYAVIANMLSTRRTNECAESPLPTSPARGEVPIGASAPSASNTPAGTLPIVGRAAEGGAPGSAPAEKH